MVHQGQPPPLIYTSLTTRRRSYPRWIIIKGSPLPIPVQRATIGNDVCLALLSERRAVEVPAFLNNVVDSLGWLQTEAPFPLATCYGVLVRQLYLCTQPNYNILDPQHSHMNIIISSMHLLLSVTGHDLQLFNLVLDSVKREIQNRWGNQLPFVQFSDVLLESFNYIRQVSHLTLRLCFLFTITDVKLSFNLFFFLFNFHFFFLSAFDYWVGIINFPSSGLLKNFASLLHHEWMSSN